MNLTHLKPRPLSLFIGYWLSESLFSLTMSELKPIETLKIFSGK